jgi:hypothetical protein
MEPSEEEFPGYRTISKSPFVKGTLKRQLGKINGDCFQLQLSLDAHHNTEALRQVLPAEPPEARYEKGRIGGCPTTPFPSPDGRCMDRSQG